MARKSKNEMIEEAQAKKESASFEMNYAEDPAIAARAASFITTLIQNAKTARSGKEDEWLEYLRMWACQLSDAQMYSGRSNLMIPEVHKQIEASTQQFQSGLFPNDDYLGAIPNTRTSKEETQDIRDAVFHELDYKNNLPGLGERWNRQKVMYGSAFFKLGFERKMRTVFQKVDDSFPRQSQVPIFQGVRVAVKDTFHTYVYPETAQNMEDALLCFDEMYVQKHVLEKMTDSQGKKLYVNLSQVPSMPQENSTLNWVDSVRLTIANFGSASSFLPDGVLIHEAWCDFNIKGNEWVPCVITIANMSTPIAIRRNPYWHQMKPYLMGRYLDAPGGELYGHSLPERISSLGYMMNDLGNQSMDSLNYSLNPITVIDPALAGDVTSFKLQPGARWFGSPQGIDFKNFPDVSQSGFAAMAQVRQMIQQFSDTAPQIAPQLSGKVRSATQTAAVQNEMTEALRNMVRNDEYSVMEPMAFMTHQLLRQFQTDEYQIVTQGPERGQWILKPIRPAILQKDVVFFWKGSSAAIKSSVRNQQLLNSFNLATQMEALLPGKIDLPKLYREVMYEAFSLKDLDIFKEDQEKRTVAPEIENLALSEGEEVEVHLGDNDDFHMRSHDEAMGALEGDDKTGAAILAYLRHNEMHKIQKQAKDALRAQQAQLMAQNAVNGQLGQSGAPGIQGNRSQTGNPASEGDMMAGMRQGQNMRTGFLPG